MKALLRKLFPDRFPLDQQTLPPVDAGGTLVVIECIDRADCEAERKRLKDRIAELEGQWPRADLNGRAAG